MIRPARASDAEGIAAIYNKGIEERQATFDTEPGAAADFTGLGDPTAAPFLVAEADGEITGWVRLTPYSPRACYAGVGEASVYVRRGARGAGVGRELLDALATAAAQRGYWKLLGLVFPENEASVALCRACERTPHGPRERRFIPRLGARGVLGPYGPQGRNACRPRWQ